MFAEGRVMRRNVFGACVTAICVAVVSMIGVSAATGASSSGQPRWLMTDLGTLGGRFSVAWAINSHGQVVGASRTGEGANHVFFWERGRMIDLGRYGVSAGRASSPTVLLNEKGQVVWAGNRTGWFLWENGVTRPLSFSVTAMNDRGQIVGTSTTVAGASEARPHAVLWENGRLRDLGFLPGSRWTSPVAINNSGVVVGVSYGRGDAAKAFLWKNGKMSGLDVLPGFQSCNAVSVNGTRTFCGGHARPTSASSRTPHTGNYRTAPDDAVHA